MITLRKAVEEDHSKIGKLIFDTVHGINKMGYDYTKEQLLAWAPNENYYSHRYLIDKLQHCYVSFDKDLLVGFGCVSDYGYIGAIYTHLDYLRKKIASRIVDVMEKKARELGNKMMSVESATPALPFFKYKDYMIENEQYILYNGQYYTCYKMHKNLI